MKYIFLLTVILLFIPNVNAQWQKVDVETDASFRGLDVVSEKVIWASGTGGTFIRSVDGGETWKVGTVSGAEKLDFRDIEAFDANAAYVLSIGNGKSSRIYKTTEAARVGNYNLQTKMKKHFLIRLRFGMRKTEWLRAILLTGNMFCIAQQTAKTGQRFPPNKCHLLRKAKLPLPRAELASLQKAKTESGSSQAEWMREFFIQKIAANHGRFMTHRSLTGLPEAEFFRLQCVIKRKA